jgi:hypothetical protein
MTASPDDSHSLFMFSETQSDEEILRLLRISISVKKKLIIFNNGKYLEIGYF